ncbi:MAG: hypothetical protein NTU76_01195 [Candidatus Taylorbacteria bacterium]|nr:hypothetical protein [Candidatus Taylorbacteria bacterium]
MREKLGQSEEQQPEEEREPERTSGIIRVPGVSPEREKEILGTVEKEIFDKQEFFKQEREKTPEEKEIVNGILAHLPEFVIKVRAHSYYRH